MMNLGGWAESSWLRLGRRNEECEKKSACFFL